MNASEEKKDLFMAISKAQGEFTTVCKNAVNPHFKSKFAPLDTIIEMIRPILAKYELSVMQFTDIAESGIIVETVIAHSSGQHISGLLAMPAVKQDPQGYGSALTYGRRYGLAAALGIVSDEDTDGNGSQKEDSKKDQTKVEFIGTPEIAAMRDLLEQGKEYNEAKFCAEARIKFLEHLPMERYRGAFAHVQKMIAAEGVEA